MEHGTPSGYRTHYHLKEKPCQPCRQAFNEYKRTYIRPKTRKAEAFRQANPSLLPAILAGWNGNPTPEQRAELDAWYERAWGLATPNTINE